MKIFLIELIRIYGIFFKVGLFTIGGGLAALPLLQSETLARKWLTNAEFADMIAVSQSTPGPIGINMATYVGFNQLGILGSIVATLGMVTPSIIIICLIAKFLKHFSENKIVKGVFLGIRPAVVGLILAAAYNIAKISMIHIDKINEVDNVFKIFDFKAMALFVVFLFATNKWKHHPIFYILIAGILGIVIF